MRFSQHLAEIYHKILCKLYYGHTGTIPGRTIKMFTREGLTDLEKARFTALRRLSLGQGYKKDFFVPSENVFEDIHKYNIWGSNETRSGPSSNLSATTKTREFLTTTLKKYNITSILDAGCGDFHFMQNIDLSGIKYTGLDISKSMIESATKTAANRPHHEFFQADITREKLPTADLIFCKDCLQHLSFKDVKKAVNNFRQSGTKYLLVTTYPLTLKNWDINTGDFRWLNLTLPPLRFPQPMEYFQEEHGTDNFMFLYEIKKLPRFRRIFFT